MTTGNTAESFGDDIFSRDITGLTRATGTQTVDLADGSTYDLVAAPVRKRIGDSEVRVLAYNGSVPGPTLRVRQGSSVSVNFTNQTDLENTIHWHGLRLENRFDGTHETQASVPPGGHFTYRVRFVDPGIYWYHPHIREDYGQEMGLYGNIVVVPAAPDYWPPAHREVVLTLDDVLIEDGNIAPFRRAETTYAAMGRFGNVFLVGGETGPTLAARVGEAVRFCLTNTANTRVFNVGLPGVRIKLVGGDSGRYEREEFVDSVVIAPSERVVIDVLFDQPGRLTLEHRTPKRTYALAAIEVSPERVTPALSEQFEQLRHNPEWAVERERLAPYFEAPPAKTLALVAEMDMGQPQGPVVYSCPMHPDVGSNEPGSCPKCGMKLMPTAAPAKYVCPMHPEVVSDESGSCPKCGMKLVSAEMVERPSGHGHEHGDVQHGADHHLHSSHGHEMEEAGGIEWEDDMVAVNRMTTPANTRWHIIDRATGARDHAIGWEFRVGDRVKIRLINEMESDHPMHHPFHFHGAGRFVVLARNGAREENFVWKDTVLLRTGQTVDILLDVTNPGVWMAHCHIAEHHESGMMFSFRVVE
ncbi:MAG: multicopper oxidase domain-containing protein [Thermomicrobiales bacterium]